MLISFIKFNNNAIFLPDCATSHYSKNVLEYFKQPENRVLVQRHFNPPKVRELRPIEQFWAILKQKVFCKGYVTNNKDTLILKIKKRLNVNESVFQSMMVQVRLVADHDIDSLL